MIKNIKASKLNIRMILPILHIAFTFLFERAIFIFSWDNIAFRTTIPKNFCIGDKTEMVLTYALSKLVATVLIILFWKLIYAIKDKKIDKSVLRLFAIIFVIGLVLGLVLYPDTFGLEVDNFATYALARRFLPMYWHSIYTGALYAGCMMILPHPISIFIIQWTLAVSVIGYIFIGVDRITKGSKAKYLTLLFFLLPDTFDVVFNAYRNNYYTLLCLFYFAYLFFTYKESKKLSTKELVVMATVSSFIMVWRSEGLFIGAGGFLFLLIFSTEHKAKVLITSAMALVVSFLAIRGIQGIGDDKYYGKDYSIINTTNVLYGILNNPNADVNYEGALEDLTNLNEVVPLQILKEKAVVGYRDYNYTMGHLDGNQTCATDEQAAKYMSSYYSLISHNITDYINRQLDCVCYALELNVPSRTYYYNGDTYTELTPFVYTQRENGKEEVYTTLVTAKWKDNTFRSTVSEKVFTLYYHINDILKAKFIKPAVKILALIIVLIIFIIEFIKFIARKKPNYYLLFVAMIIMTEMAGIIAFVPEGRPYYFFPMIYSSFLVIYFMIIGNQ